MGAGWIGFCGGMRSAARGPRRFGIDSEIVGGLSISGEVWGIELCDFAVCVGDEFGASAFEFFVGELPFVAHASEVRECEDRGVVGVGFHATSIDGEHGDEDGRDDEDDGGWDGEIEEGRCCEEWLSGFWDGVDGGFVDHAWIVRRVRRDFTSKK